MISYLFFLLGDGNKLLSTTIDQDVKQSNIHSTASIHRNRAKKTIDRAQQTSASKMPVVNEKTSTDPPPPPPPKANLPISNATERKHSFTSATKPSSSEEVNSTIIPDDDTGPELKSHNTSDLRKQTIQASKYVNELPVTSRSMVIRKGKTSSLKWSASVNTRKYRSRR